MSVYLQGRTQNYLQPGRTWTSRNQQDALQVCESNERAKVQTSSKWSADKLDKAKIKTLPVRFGGLRRSVSNLMAYGGKSRHQRSQNDEGHGKCQRPLYDTQRGPWWTNTWTIILKGIILHRKIHLMAMYKNLNLLLFIMIDICRCSIWSIC